MANFHRGAKGTSASSKQSQNIHDFVIGCPSLAAILEWIDHVVLISSSNLSGPCKTRSHVSGMRYIGE